MYISEWTSTKPFEPIYAQYPNSARVAQVEHDDEIFPVGGDLFWTDCPDNCVADKWWYDMISKTIQIIDNAPIPAETDQPITTGIQTA